MDGSSSPRQHRQPTQGLCFVRGLISSGRLGTYWEIPSEASSAIQSVGRPVVGLFLLEGSHAPWIAGPKLSGWLGEILTHRGAWPQLAPARTNDGPWCLAKVQSIIHSQPASRQPAQPTETEAGGFPPPAYASQTVSHVVARVPYRQGRATPANHEGCQPALGYQSMSIAPLQDRTRQRPVQLKLSALRVQSTLTAAGGCGCAVDMQYGTIRCCTCCGAFRSSLS